MAKLFDTAHLDERLMASLSGNEASWIYNGLDCCITAEIFNELDSQLQSEPESVRETYQTALAKHAPIMEMSLRGVRIDESARQETLRALRHQLKTLDAKFQRIMREVWDTELNWNSPVQVKNLFYGMLGLKEIRKRNANGQYVSTVNREALEYFQIYHYARPLAAFVLTLRDIAKAISFLKTEIDTDSRIRTNYNIAGTNTGRLSSSAFDFGTGTNLQNVDRNFRYPFVPDPGMYFVNIDLEQADARNVAARIWQCFYDSHGEAFAGKYLDAAESGDLHTFVCRMAWTELEWPEEQSGWRAIADQTAYRDKSYRDLAKALGHGTNYFGTPRTMAKHTHTERKIIEDFQQKYFAAFPGIPAWHEWVINEIKSHGTLYNLFGRRRMFFGRGNDASTHRKAIAYDPQSTTGEQIDRGLLAVWRRFDQDDVQLLAQVHDSILFQVPFRRAEELIPAVLETMKVEIELKGGRMFSVPLEAKTGWNWGDFDKRNPNKNPHGLKGWKGSEERKRPSPKRRFTDYL